MLADLAGGDWPKLAREACTAFVTGARDDTETVSARLLRELREVFRDAEALSTETILRELHKLDEAPWGDWYGHPLTARDLAKLLRPYGVSPRRVRVEDATPGSRGYTRADLVDTWNRFAPDESATSATSATGLARSVALVADVAHTGQPCTECGQPLDPALIVAGFTTHGEETAQ